MSDASVVTEAPSLEHALVRGARSLLAGVVDVRAGKKRWLFYLEGGRLIRTRSNLKSEQAEAIQSLDPATVLSPSEVAHQQAVRRVQNARKAAGATLDFREGSRPKEREELALGAVLAAGLAGSGGERVAELEELLGGWPFYRPDLVEPRWNAEQTTWLESMKGGEGGEELVGKAPGGRDAGLVNLWLAFELGEVGQGEAPSVDAGPGVLPDLDIDALIADVQAGDGVEDDPTDSGSGGHVASLPGRTKAPVLTIEVPVEHPLAPQLASLATRLSEAGNHFEVLDVPWDSSASGFRASYMSLAQQLHPDRYTEAPAALQEQATALFDKVREAWSVLEEGESRQAYIDKVIHGKKTEDELAMEQIQAYWAAETEFKRGLASFKNGRVSQADGAFQKAALAVPDELEWVAYAAFTRWHTLRNKQPERAEAAIEQLKQVLERNKSQERKLDMAWVLLGRSYRERNMIEPAKRCIVQALRHNPANADAQLEMKRIKAAIESGKAKGGIFGRLFGKKS